MRDELNLIRAVQAGNKESFEDLVAPYLVGLEQELVRLTGNHADAKDALQDAMIAVWKHLPRYQHIDRFEGWLRTITRNAGISLLRKRTARRVLRSAAGATAEAPPDQERRALARQNLELVARCLAELPDEQGEVVVLRMVDALTFREIAERQGVPIGTVLSRMDAARNRLRDALKAFFFDRPWVTASVAATALLLPQEAGMYRPSIQPVPLLVAAVLMTDPTLTQIQYDGNALPTETPVPWLVTPTADPDHTVTPVVDPDADDGWALDLQGRRLLWSIADFDLEEFDNDEGWTFEVRHLAISNEAPADLNFAPYSSDSDRIAVGDGAIWVGIDFRPGEFRVTTDGLGGSTCAVQVEHCRIWSHPVDEYQTIRISGQGNEIQVWVNDDTSPWIASKSESFGKGIAFGNATTGIRYAAHSRWDYIRWIANTPGPTTLTTTGDTYLKQGKPNKNQGTEEILRLRQSGKNRPLVEFSQSEILSAVGSASVASATLRLHIDFNANNWGNSGREVGVHRMTDLWTELGATWKCGIDADTSNQQPNCDPQWVMQNSSLWPFEDATDTVLHEKFQTGWVEFDVTADVQAFVDGSAANLGWIIKKVNEGQAGHVQYSSREGDNPPELLIVTQ